MKPLKHLNNRTKKKIDEDKILNKGGAEEARSGKVKAARKGTLSRGRLWKSVKKQAIPYS